MEDKNLKAFFYVIRKLRGIDLNSYRQNFVLRRLNYRINTTKSRTITDYLTLLKKDNAEFNRFLDALAINVSEFFRDSSVFDYFRKKCLSELMNRKRLSNNKIIRIWSAGCAQGQEPYSLAILLKEEQGKEDNFRVKILGTDIDKDSLESARKAEYNLRSLKEVKVIRRRKYFSHLPNGSFRLNDEIRHMVNFFQCDLVNDPPLKYVDVIFCRNVMIYFSQQQQELLLAKFYKALTSKGYLVMGKVEAIRPNLRDIFVPITLHEKIYQKK